jgi:hypothetical protein
MIGDSGPGFPPLSLSHDGSFPRVARNHKRKSGKTRMFTKTREIITDKIAEPIKNNALFSISAFVIAIIALIVAAVRK